MPWKYLMVQFSFEGARENLIKKVTFKWQLKPIFTLVFVYFSFYFLNISVFFFFRIPPLFFFLTLCTICTRYIYISPRLIWKPSILESPGEHFNMQIPNCTQKFECEYWLLIFLAFNKHPGFSPCGCIELETTEVT